MKKAETQEQEFLEVCSSYDHDLLTGKKEMTLKDYERITYLVSSLGYSQYLQFLIGKYMDLAQADESLLLFFYQHWISLSTLEYR